MCRNSGRPSLNQQHVAPLPDQIIACPLVRYVDSSPREADDLALLVEFQAFKRIRGTSPPKAPWGNRQHSRVPWENTNISVLG